MSGIKIARAASPPTKQEGTPMFDPVPRSAPERLKGAAFAHQMILRQVDAGLPADQIQARHDAAVTTLTQAARSDGDREFLAGFTATGQDHIDTLLDTQHIVGCQLRWERAQETEPEREAADMPPSSTDGHDLGLRIAAELDKQKGGQPAGRLSWRHLELAALTRRACAEAEREAGS